MEIKNIHKFEVKSEEEFLIIQNNLVNNFKEENINFCAGVDLAYWEKENEQYGVCSIVVINNKTKEVAEKVYSYGKITTLM